MKPSRSTHLRHRSVLAGVPVLAAALALAGCGGTGGDGGSPAGAASPATTSAAPTTQAAVAQPRPADFPGCAEATCTVYDVARVDHPKQGPMLLALVAKRGKTAGDKFGASARMYAVDGSGRVTDPYGKRALAPDNPKTSDMRMGYFFGIEYAHPKREVHFMSPATDATGGVFFDIMNKEESFTPPALRVNANGYFKEMPIKTDLTRSEEDLLPGYEWGTVDTRGYYTIRVNTTDESGANKRFTLHRRGEQYVRV